MTGSAVATTTPTPSWLNAAVDDYRPYVEEEPAQLVGADDGVRRRAQGRRRAEGEGPVRPDARPLRDDRAGRRELRRPRPGDRRARQRRRRRATVDRLPPDRAERCGARTRPTGWRRSPTSCSPTSKSSTADPDARPPRPRSSPTAPSSCSTRSRTARSPARRTATRTPTCRTSRPTSTARRRRSTTLEPALGERGDAALATKIDARFADVQTRRSTSYRRDTPLGFALYAELTTEDRAQFAQQIDALAEPLSQVAADRVRRPS